jgi:hypothetical protein
MKPESSESEGMGQVILLRRPGRAPATRPTPRSPAPTDQDALHDIDRYERTDETPDDYRHRMLVNLLAFGFCIFLVVAGIWLFTTISEIRKNQDCVLSGRRGCTPVQLLEHSPRA